jgi:high affinity Mn2+ porin
VSKLRILSIVALSVLLGRSLAFGEGVQLSTAPSDDWTMHEQITSILQGHEPFTSPYEGPNSLYPGTEGRTSVTSTLFLGRRLWNGGALFVNPEFVAGQGFSHTTGLAGFPNGEIYRVDNPRPKIVLSRLYYQQTWGFTNKVEMLETDENQLGGPVPVDRLTFVAGKFSLTDFFDNNTYSHDPRTQFMNWSLFTNGTWDYAADTRGYTYGFYSEYNRADWAVRAATVMEPRQANQLTMDPRVFQAHGDELEFERRYFVDDHPGKLRLLGWWNHAHMGNYAAAITEAGSGVPDITATRAYSQKYGFGVNIEQGLTSVLGFFARAGWDDGRTETWAFTEIDRTAQAGFSLKGTPWNRPGDVLGSAFVVNGLSPDHRNYLAAGGVGFIIGDGKLNYAPEQIWETYYAAKFWKHLTLTPDIQLVKNPAYNADRGPVVIGSLRFHVEF